MKYINFKELVESLECLKGVELKKSSSHINGVYREYVFKISPYILTITYMEFSNQYVPLKFFALKEGEEPIHFCSVQQFTDIFPIKIYSLGEINLEAC